MPEVRIVAEPRTEFGKGAARRVRRADKVPAVLYGHGEPPRHLSLPGHELMLALKQGQNQLLRVTTADGEHLALPRSVVRDPIKGFLEHVDFLAIRKGERVSVEIPIVLTGEPAPEVLVDHQMTSLTVEADATEIPDTLELSVEGLSAGTILKATEVPLPEGVTLDQDPERVIVAGLAVMSEEALEAELESAEEDLGAGQVGAEAAEEAAEDDASAAGEPTEGEADKAPADQS